MLVLTQMHLVRLILTTTSTTMSSSKPEVILLTLVVSMSVLKVFQYNQHQRYKSSMKHQHQTNMQMLMRETLRVPNRYSSPSTPSVYQAEFVMVCNDELVLYEWV